MYEIWEKDALELVALEISSLLFDKHGFDTS
jgi:hypothetical protein